MSGISRNVLKLTHLKRAVFDFDDDVQDYSRYGLYSATRGLLAIRTIWTTRDIIRSHNNIVCIYGRDKIQHYVVKKKSEKGKVGTVSPPPRQGT